MQRFLIPIILSLLFPAGLWAHGAEYTLLEGGVIGVQATFDTGEFMAGARTLIFAPGETQAYLETITDSRGIVAFSPDRSGLWVLQVRAEGGHGLRVNLEVDESMLPDLSRRGGFTPLQRIVMVLCVVWALVATALYFSTRRKARQPRSHQEN